MRIELPLQPTALDTFSYRKGLTRLEHNTMQTGTIARLTDKGFGFIKVEGMEKDLFFHTNELIGVMFDELREGDKLSFEVADSPKGPNAIKISRA